MSVVLFVWNCCSVRGQKMTRVRATSNTQNSHKAQFHVEGDNARR